jgi:hypothetical protein
MRLDPSGILNWNMDIAAKVIGTVSMYLNYVARNNPFNSYIHNRILRVVGLSAQCGLIDKATGWLVGLTLVCKLSKHITCHAQ